MFFPAEHATSYHRTCHSSSPDGPKSTQLLWNQSASHYTFDNWARPAPQGSPHVLPLPAICCAHFFLNVLGWDVRFGLTIPGLYPPQPLLNRSSWTAKGLAARFGT